MPSDPRSSPSTPSHASPSRRRAGVNGPENRKLWRYAVALVLAVVLLVLVFNRIGPDGLYFRPEHRSAAPSAPLLASEGPWRGVPAPSEGPPATAVATLPAGWLMHPLGEPPRAARP